MVRNDDERSTRDTQGQRGEVRPPEPESARQDPAAAARQEQVHRDHDAMQADARRVEASAPADARNKTIGQIVDDAERKGDETRER